MPADETQALIDILRRGQYEDPTEKIAALTAALLEEQAELPLLLNLLRAPQIPLRLAALNALGDCEDPKLLEELTSLTTHADIRIRIQLSGVLAPRTERMGTSALQLLLKDHEPLVRAAALRSTRGREEFRLSQQTALLNDADWGVRMAAVQALEGHTTPEIIEPLFRALAKDEDTDVGRRCAEIIEQRLEAAPEATQARLPTDIATIAKAEKNLTAAESSALPKLTGWISARTVVEIDPKTLVRFGTDLTAQALAGTLPRAYEVEELCQTVVKMIQRQPWRSLALLGPTGVGKSALVNQLVYELVKPENGSWRVLRISPTDFMAGTRYVGEWETKVHDLVEAIRHPRRVVVYVPNLSDLSAVGTWSKSESSVATALGPYLEDGSILLLGESSPEQFERGIGRVPSLQRLFDKVLLTETSIEITRDVLVSVAQEATQSISEEVLDQLLEVSGQFISHISRPGNAVMLLRDVLQDARHSDQPIKFRAVLNALSKSTGVPSDLLDDSIPLHTAEVREFFERRIIGQPEAVEAVVDLVTLIKAGVTDPQKPFAVFFFIGPTGVGKTELARALAEFIFGDVSRLKRFDMSEFAGAEAFNRLIGGANDNGVLTDAVRQNPFSVILLDEIEKSHLNVFDLCLQIFDAGRLTDGRGRTVDFRRTIVILTSNIGANIASTPLGFGAPASSPVEIDKERTFRELSRFFRPEFLNRLDRIVEFRPLSLQVAEQIARREIDLVLQRSGIRRRRLAVDIDPAVVSLLVREGYSPHFGARPLKRVVERRLLLPLARVISSGSLRGPSMLRLTEQDGRVVATVVQAPLRGETVATPKALPAPAQRFDGLLDTYASLEPTIRPFEDRKSELILQTRQPGFFQNVTGRTAIFDEIHKLDQFLNQFRGLGKVLVGMRERLERQPGLAADTGAFAEKLEQLAAELEHLRSVAACRDARDMSDALLSLSLVDRNGSAQNSVSKLTEMYQGLAGRRRMTAEVLGEFYEDPHDRVYLLVAGLGAYALVKDERGLHQMDRRFKERTPRAGREVIREDREIVRVETWPVAAEPPQSFEQQVRTKFTVLKPAKTRLLTKAEIGVSAFDEAAVRSADFWTNGPKNQALQRALLILHAQRDGGIPSGPSHEIVRHYDVGLAPKAKDTRTGRSTTRIDRVFKGDLTALRGE